MGIDLRIYARAIGNHNQGKKKWALMQSEWVGMD